MSDEANELARELAAAVSDRYAVLREIGRGGSAVVFLATDLKHDLPALAEEAIRANIRASVDQLRHGSEVLEQLIREQGLLIVGAEYSLETGLVDFFEGAVL